MPNLRFTKYNNKSTSVCPTARENPSWFSLLIIYLEGSNTVEYVIEKEGMKTKKEERHSCCSDDLNDRVHKKKKKGKMKGKRHHLT